MTTLTRRTTLAALAAAAAALTLANPAPGGAQQVLGPRWQGWLGCWSAAPSDRLRETGPDAPRIVCITPTPDGDIVDVSAIAEGRVVSRDRIDASGATHAIEAPGCKGSQSARWSADGRRVFLRSVVTCDGTPTEMSAILAITPSGEWLDVRRVAAGGGSDVRVARYHDVGLPSLVPADIANAFDTRNSILFHDARLAAGTPVGAAAIIEASRASDPSVVESWVVESGQHFAVDARTLSQLADAGVPARVTDAMIAVSRVADAEASHTVFYSPYGWNGRNGPYGQNGRYGPDGQYGQYSRGSADAWDQGTRSRLYVNIYEYDPWGFGYWPLGNRFGGAPFGYGFRYGVGNSFGDGYGIGYGFGYEHSYRRGTAGSRVGYYYPPVIVLHNDPTGTAPRGRSVKGEGYTPDVRQAGTEQRTAVQRRPEPRPEPRREPVVASAGSGSQASTPASAPAREAPQRTAKPRP